MGSIDEMAADQTLGERDGGSEENRSVGATPSHITATNVRLRANDCPVFTEFDGYESTRSSYTNSSIRSS